MRITLRHNSDRLALLTGNPRRLSLGYSADPATVAKTLPRRADGEHRTVLLLGGNGFVGINLLRELLADDRVDRVYALVRPKGDNSGEARIRRQARKYKLTLPPQDKLTVLEGSYLEDDMGLPAETYRELLTTVDLVIDGAGATTHEYPYARYREEKVLPTLRLAEFCLTERFKTLHVIGSIGSEVYQQRRDFYRGSFFYCGYSKMKYVVKHISLAANRAGVPIHVYQAPFALGGPHTAFKDPGLEYSFWNMMLHLAQQKKAWPLAASIPTVAADVLARAVLNNALSDLPQAITYPVTPVTTTDLVERWELEMVTWPEFRRGLTRDHDVRLRDVNWRHPVSSIRRAAQRAKFVRSLFPRCLPRLLTNIHDAATGSATLLGAGLPVIDVVDANARNIRKLAKALPAAVPVTEGDTVRKAA